MAVISLGTEGQLPRRDRQVADGSRCRRPFDRSFREVTVNVRYFPDTDTLLVNFSDRPVVRTHDLAEDILLERDDQGRLVSMTVEHAKHQMNLHEPSHHLATG